MCLSVIHLGEGVNEDVRPFNWLHVIYYFTRLAREREREHLIFILYSFNHMALLKTSLGLNISVFKKKKCGPSRSY